MTDSQTMRAVQIVSQDGTTWIFRTWPQFIRWLEETLAAWQWVPAGGHDPENLTHYILRAGTQPYRGPRIRGCVGGRQVCVGTGGAEDQVG